jgi:hypothetical protein
VRGFPDDAFRFRFVETGFYLRVLAVGGLVTDQEILDIRELRGRNVRQFIGRTIPMP